MNPKIIATTLSFCFILGGCAPVKSPISNQYKLSKFSQKRYSRTPSKKTILVSVPQASSGYTTEQMLYVAKPNTLAPFAHNAWVDQPSNMLFPLIYQSLQHARYFRAVASTPYAEETDYRLDSQLIEFQQNFLKKPSVVQMSIKVTLSDLKQNTVLGSRVFRREAPCPINTPLGGVEAANRITRFITNDITNYVIQMVG